jgi:hypothetical protein
MIAERENVKVNFERESRLVIVTKARIFSSEGWNVVLMDGEGKPFEPVELQKPVPVADEPAPEAPAEAA